MNLIFIAAFIAVCSAAKLDRTYLPPASAKTAGGSAGSLQAPFPDNSINRGQSNIPKGGFSNEFQGVVVDAAAPGTRASESETGLGAPRPTYGSTDSKVGNAAFRGNEGLRQQQSQPSNEDVTIDANEQPFSAVSGFAPAQGFESKPERSQAAYDRVANTLRFENEVGPESYHYAFETDNGISAEENGVATNGVQAQGGFSYTGDDGQVYTITYTADEGGYRPRGDHLPTPPPIPVEILRALERNAKDEADGVIDDGSYDAEKYNTGVNYAGNKNINAGQNNGQASEFSNRPESDASASGTFINQNNQAFDNSLNGQDDNSGKVQPNNAYSSSTNINGNAQPFDSRIPTNRFGSKQSSTPSYEMNQNGNPERPAAFGNKPQYESNFNNNSPSLDSSTNQGSQPQIPSTQQFGSPTVNRLDVLAQSSGNGNSQSESTFTPAQGQFTKNPGSTFASKNEYLPPYRSQDNRPQRPLFGKNNPSQRVPQPNFQSTAQAQPSRFTQGSVFSNNGAQKPQQFSNFQPTLNVNNQQSAQNDRTPSSSFNTQSPTSLPSTELTTPLEPEQSNVDSSENNPSFEKENSNVMPGFQFPSNNGQQSVSPQAAAVEPQDINNEYSSQDQNQYQSSSIANKQPSFFQNSFNQGQRGDSQYAPSTVRPTFNTQAQGADQSYYYRQPAKPFNAPTTPGSRYPTGQSGQFNRVPQMQQNNGQFPQQNVPLSPIPSQKNRNQGTTRYPQPPTVPAAVPTSAFGNQYQGNPLPNQYNGITQASISPFRPQNQASTRYPQPPTLAPTLPTFGAQRFPSQFNGLTQTTAFVSSPTMSSNFASRPTPQQAQPLPQQSFNQEMQSFTQPQSEPTSATLEETSQTVSSQQYTGEIYDYSKPSESLPAEAEPTSTPQRGQGRPQFQAVQNSQEINTQQQMRPTFGGRPQYESESTQSKSPSQNIASTDQPEEDLKPNFNGESQSFTGAQPQSFRPQFGAQNNAKPSKCCQSLDAQIAKLKNQQQQAQRNNGFSSRTQFNNQFPGSLSQSPAQSFGRGETFVGPRQPPSFDQETGYHY